MYQQQASFPKLTTSTDRTWNPCEQKATFSSNVVPIPPVYVRDFPRLERQINAA